MTKKRAAALAVMLIIAGFCVAMAGTLAVLLVLGITAQSIAVVVVYDADSARTRAATAAIAFGATVLITVTITTILLENPSKLITLVIVGTALGSIAAITVLWKLAVRL
jgi:hypothetical protein